MTPQGSAAAGKSGEAVAGESARSAAAAGLDDLLAEHCRRLEAEGGALLRLGQDGRVDVLAVHPRPRPGAEPPGWLRQAVRSAAEAASSGEPVVKGLAGPDDLYLEPTGRQLVLLGLPGGGTGRGVAAFIKQTGDGRGLAAEAGRTSLDVSVLSLYQMHVTAGGRPSGPAELQPAIATLAAVNEHDRFLPAAMAFCNELAARWQCDRVSVGFLHGRYVQIKAMSHTERFSRKMKLVQLIEAAMEECLDQDLEVTWPAGEEAEFVNRSGRELSEQHGRLAVLSLPLRRAGQVVAAATLERPADHPFSPAEIETVRLVCELCTPRLVSLARQDRWIGARAAAAFRRVPAAIVGPKHTWLKLLAVLLLAAAVFLVFAKGEYRISAPFVFQAERQQVLTAPFEGQLEKVLVKVGQRVEAGQILAELRTLPLQRELNRAEAELFEHRKETDAARAEKRWAEAQMAAARAEQLAQRMDLLRERIETAKIKALIEGTVVRGDLERFVGATVQKGQVLMEVAPIRQLRAELSVPADQIADLLTAMKRGPVGGNLTATSYPNQRIAFIVERVHPMAEEENGRNVFKVRAGLDTTASWMRPGMEGIARVTVEKRHYAWIWSRRTVNWLRLKLWL